MELRATDVHAAPPLRSAEAAVHSPSTSDLVAALLVFAGTGASLGLFGGLLTIEDLAKFAQTNELDGGIRRALITWTLGGCALAALAPLTYVAMSTARSSAGRVCRLAEFLCPLTLLWALPLLFDWRLFADHGLLHAVCCAAFGLALERTLRPFFAAVGPARLERASAAFANAFPGVARWGPLVATSLLAVTFATYCSYWTIIHHLNLGTSAYDLGIYDNIMNNLLRGTWFRSTPDLPDGSSHIQGHANLSFYLLVPFYALHRGPEMLLAIQATVVGLAAFPIYLLARNRFGNGLLSVVFPFLYVIDGAVHGAVFYDFHDLTLAPLFIASVLYLFEKGSRGWLAVAYLSAVLLREDQSATLAAACLFFVLVGQRVRLALVGGVVSLASFLLIKFVFMKAYSTGPEELHSYMYQGLVAPGFRDFPGVLATLVSNPVFAVSSILTAAKLEYVLRLLTPLVFLPLRNAKTWILLVPAATFTLLTTDYAPTVTTSFQYTMYWVPYLLYGAMVVLSSWKARPDGSTRTLAAACAMVLVGVIMSYRNGAIFQNPTFHGGFTSIRFEHTSDDVARLDRLRALIHMIPPDASVAATEHVSPHVSTRADCYSLLRHGDHDATYVLADTREVGSSVLWNAVVQTGRYAQIASNGEFQLWKRTGVQVTTPWRSP